MSTDVLAPAFYPGALVSPWPQQGFFGWLERPGSGWEKVSWHWDRQKTISLAEKVRGGQMVDGRLPKIVVLPVGQQPR